MNRNLTLVLPLIAAFLGACSSTPTTPEATPADTASTPSAAQASTSNAATPSSKVTSVVLPAHKDPKNPIYTHRSVYFEYDDFSVKTDYSALIEQHAKYLQKNPTLAIRIEGNADERGSAEYNLALGNKRALAVVDAMKIYGAKETQMEAVSYGEEKPKATAHDETAWAENRRADIVYAN